MTKMTDPGDEPQASHPLRDVSVMVGDIEDNPGFLRMELCAVSRFQVEGVDVNLSLVNQMPKAKVQIRAVMRTERPLWSRSIITSSQYFQQQVVYTVWTAKVIARMGLSHSWRVMGATSKLEMFKLGRLQAHRLQVRFQDDTMIDTGNVGAPPSALSLDGADGEAVIVLALPLMQANGDSCLKPEEVAERSVRFRQRWRDVRNQFEEGTRQIAVMRLELTLRFAHQDNNDYLTCPPVRLQRDSQGTWLIGETFLPPLLRIQGSCWLTAQLEQLLTQLRARLTYLMAMRRESNEWMVDFAVADASLFWSLNALNSAEPVLEYFLRYQQSPPEHLHPELACLAGGLLTFSFTHQVNAIPIYQHDQLNAVFPPLFDLLSDLLEASLPSRVMAIALEHDTRLHFWQARPRDARLRGGADYYLSVHSSVPTARLQGQFSRQCKVSSPDHVKATVNSSWARVPLTPLCYVPTATPLRLESQCFSLDVSHPLASEMLQNGTYVFYVLGILGELEPELFAVLQM